jgi:hypothetical protein
MPPKDKIAANSAVSKEKFNSPSCIYCGFPHCWKHGTYLRKGFHQRPNEPERGLVSMQRYLCRSSLCDRTFSELPESVLPYCRFFMSGFLSIADDLTAGKSSYWIAKYKWGISLRVVLRVVSLIRKVTPWLTGLCREVAGSVAPGFYALITTIREKVFQRDFSRLKLLNLLGSGSKSLRLNRISSTNRLSNYSPQTPLVTEESSRISLRSVLKKPQEERRKSSLRISSIWSLLNYRIEKLTLAGMAGRKALLNKMLFEIIEGFICVANAKLNI